MVETVGVWDALERVGRGIWWIVATVAVAWVVIRAAGIPPLLGWGYVVGNLVGTVVGLRLHAASLEEWGGDRTDRRPLMRVACVAQLPVGWVVIGLVLLGLI